MHAHPRPASALFLFLFFTTAFASSLFAERVDCDNIDDDKRAYFEVAGKRLIMNGVIDTKTPLRLKKLLRRHADIRLIVLECVYGSVDDDANLEAARMIRKAGIATHLASGGEIASGGTDFFLAGVKRTVGKDVLIGVHGWIDDEGLTARSLPRSHADHQSYLKYYREMGIPASFYWFTLETPHDKVHNMTPAELRKYRIVTR